MAHAVHEHEVRVVVRQQAIHAVQVTRHDTCTVGPEADHLPHPELVRGRYLLHGIDHCHRLAVGDLHTLKVGRTTGPPRDLTMSTRCFSIDRSVDSSSPSPINGEERMSAISSFNVNESGQQLIKYYWGIVAGVRAMMQS